MGFCPPSPVRLWRIPFLCLGIFGLANGVRVDTNIGSSTAHVLSGENPSVGADGNAPAETSPASIVPIGQKPGGSAVAEAVGGCANSSSFPPNTQYTANSDGAQKHVGGLVSQDADWEGSRRRSHLNHWSSRRREPRYPGHEDERARDEKARGDATPQERGDEKDREDRGGHPPKGLADEESREEDSRRGEKSANDGRERDDRRAGRSSEEVRDRDGERGRKSANEDREGDSGRTTEDHEDEAGGARNVRDDREEDDRRGGHAPKGLTDKENREESGREGAKPAKEDREEDGGRGEKFAKEDREGGRGRARSKERADEEDRDDKRRRED